MISWKIRIKHIVITDISNVENNFYSGFTNKFFYTIQEYKLYTKRLYNLALKKFGENARIEITHDTKFEFNDIKIVFDSILNHNSGWCNLVDIASKLNVTSNYAMFLLNKFLNEGLITEKNNKYKIVQ